MKKRSLSMSQREALTGLFFVGPFLIGTCVFFLYPVISSFLLSFGSTDKKHAGFHIVLTGFQNYYSAFFVDTNFVPKLLRVVQGTLISIPLIVIFSLLLAVLLNKLTWIKGFFRVVVILPFLLGTGEVMTQLLNQGIDSQIIAISNGNVLPRQFILYLGTGVVTALDTLFGTIVKVLWSSGVQILLFLSAIQSISPSLYESARIDGANEYEMFWKITIPVVSPIILLNAIYTIISSFTESSNVVLLYIKDQVLNLAAHGYAAALGWIYFAFIALLIGVVALLVGKYVRSTQVTGGRK